MRGSGQRFGEERAAEVKLGIGRQHVVELPGCPLRRCEHTVV